MAISRTREYAADNLGARMDTENDILFLILTSHGSPAGLAVKAGRLTQTLTRTCWRGRACDTRW
jgi:hypothetical protein